MTADREPKQRHLVVGEQTKDIKPGVRIVGGDPSATRFTVKEVGESGQLNVEITDLITEEIRTAPMPEGTPVIIQDPEK